MFLLNRRQIYNADPKIRLIRSIRPFRKNNLDSFAEELQLSVHTCAQNLQRIYDKVETYAANIVKETTIRGAIPSVAQATTRLGHAPLRREQHVSSPTYEDSFASGFLGPGRSFDEPYRAMMYTGLLGGNPLYGGATAEGSMWRDLARSRREAQATNLDLPVFVQWATAQKQQQGLALVWAEGLGVWARI